MVREAIGLRHAREPIDAERLVGATITAVVDNRGLAARFWMGAWDPEVNDELTCIALALRSIEVVLTQVLWTERRNLEIEEALFREQLWFNSVAQNWEPTTNVDAFAAEDDHRRESYAAIDRTGAIFDGVSAGWTEEAVPWCFPPVGAIVAEKLVEERPPVQLLVPTGFQEAGLEPAAC